MSLFFPASLASPLERGCFAFLLLITYSLLGWCGEMVYCSIGQRRLCEKRGFLNGPLCPIYGHGALLVLTALGGSTNPLVTFAAGAVLTSAVEYVTSYLMEKLFHMRWWDYSQFRFHLNGRICLLNSALFGLASVFLCHAANPLVTAWLTGLFAVGVGTPLALLLLAVYLADIVLSVRSAIRIGDRLAKLHAVHDGLSAASGAAARAGHDLHEVVVHHSAVNGLHGQQQRHDLGDTGRLPLGVFVLGEEDGARLLLHQQGRGRGDVHGLGAGRQRQYGAQQRDQSFHRDSPLAALLYPMRGGGHS